MWGNDLGMSGWNGAYANNINNWLRSPIIDCSGQTGVHLSFQRWLTVEDGIYDQARIKVNGTQVWVNPGGTGDLIDTSWQDDRPRHLRDRRQQPRGPDRVLACSPTGAWSSAAGTSTTSP